jgi:hypothetical protein
MSKYPECEKVQEIQKESQAIGEFLEWLTGEKGYTICKWMEDEKQVEEDEYLPVHGEDMAKCKTCGRPVPSLNNRFTDFCTVGCWREFNTFTIFGERISDIDIEQLLAEFFKIDLNKIEEEKRQMLDKIRS